MLSHRQAAKRRTVIWQGAAVALIAAAGAAAAFPQVRDALAPKPAPTNDRAAAAAPAPTLPSTVPQLQVAAIADSMNRFSPWQPAPPPPPAPVVEVPVADVPPPPTANELAYIGSIITAESRAALLRVDTQQQILGLNEAFNGVKVVTIEPSFIEVEKNGGPRQRLDLPTRVMLAPNDPPKRMPSFRPTPGGGMPMAAGAPAFNNPAAMARPMAQPAPSTFDQARAAAMAAREAAAKAQGHAAIEPPDREDPSLHETRVIAAKTLADDSLSEGDRMRALRTLGIVPGMPTETAMDLVRKHGIDMSKATAQAIEHVVGGKQIPGSEGEEKESK